MIHSTIGLVKVGYNRLIHVDSPNECKGMSHGTIGLFKVDYNKLIHVKLY